MRKELSKSGCLKLIGALFFYFFMNAVVCQTSHPVNEDLSSRKSNGSVQKNPEKELLLKVYKAVIEKEQTNRLLTKKAIGSNEKISEILAASDSFSDFIQRLSDAKIDGEIISEFKKEYYLLEVPVTK